MHSLITPLILALFFLLGALEARDNPWSYSLQDAVARTIVVDKNGKGQFTTLKEAIDSVPLNNQAWIKIHVNYGIYIEQVQIPREKPYIILEGDLNPRPEIQFNANGSVLTSPTFQALADNFVARNIVFKNTYDKLERANGKQTTQAVALTLDGDKQSLYNCRLQSLQDTLSDSKGRHYFNGCTIEGAVDFIWSIGQSLYENCEIVSLSDKLGFDGYITANGREGPNDPSAFVFKDCKITGSGPIYLGRPYRLYSRVLFYRTFMEKVVVPAGWDSTMGGAPVPLAHVSFSEVNCSGPGADTSRRVSWMKKLSDQEVMSLTTAATFIDQDGWIGTQPK